MQTRSSGPEVLFKTCVAIKFVDDDDDDDDENSVCLSVCLSVRLSVKCVICDKIEERSVQIFTSYERSFSLVF